MKTLTIQDIKDLNPCYDPTEFSSKDWEGTVIDILNVKECPAPDRLWVVLRLIDGPLVARFAEWCAKRAKKHAADAEYAARADDLADADDAARAAEHAATRAAAAARAAARADDLADADDTDLAAACAAEHAATYAGLAAAESAAERKKQITYLKRIVKENGK